MSDNCPLCGMDLAPYGFTRGPEPETPSSLAAMPGSVWLVIYQNQLTNESGVSAVISDEKRAQDYAKKCNTNHHGSVFLAQQWTIT